MSMWMLGYPDQARQSSHKALTLAQEIDHPFSLAWTLAHATIVHQFRREAQAIQERAEALMTLSTEHGFPHWLPYGMILRGWALTAQGAKAEGIAQLRQGLVAHLDTRAGLHRPYFLSLLAEAYGEAGQLEDGLAVLDEALDTVHKTEERNWEAELNRRKGELLLMQQGQKVGEVEKCFRQALEIARRQKAKSLELRAAMSLSRLWQQQRKQKEAHQLLEEIYGWFTEGFDTVDLQEAEALLEERA
jgi:predicted ATPase